MLIKTIISLEMFLCWNSLLIVIITLSITGNTIAQRNITIADENDRLSMAYTYFIAQQASLESVIDRYPALQEKAVDASKDWLREFGGAIKLIDSSLYLQKGEKWDSEKETIYNKFRRADHSNVSEKEAQQFLDIIFQRSYGKIQSPIIETLLSHKPEYKLNPEKEFSDGYINTYLSSAPKKKTPVNIRIIYPKSWKAVPGILKNNIQQVFISNYGTGQFALSFLLEQTSNIPVNNTGTVLSENALKKHCLKTDSIIQYTTGLDIDFCPTAQLTYLRREIDIDKPYCILFETYHASYKNHHFALFFSYKSEKQNYETVKTEFEKYRKLIRKILFNIVVLSQWEQQLTK